MKSIKLLACLVTLQFTSGLTLEAADHQAFREWTDAKGRQITARLVEATDSGSVKIERKDGQIFTVAATVFSQADQAYVDTVRVAQKAEAAALTAASSTAATTAASDTPAANAVDSAAAKGKFAANPSSPSRSGKGGGIGGASEQISFFGVPLTTP